MAPLILDIEAVGIDNAADYLEPVEAPSNYKDPEKIAAYIKDATAKAVDRCALDPDLCRIVAIGALDTGTGEVGIRICKDEASEADGLRWLADGMIARSFEIRPLITFNGFGYDLPVLMRRAQYLGVGQLPLLNIDKYRSPHIDLMTRLTFNGAIKPHRLKFYASRFGRPIADDIDGSQIADLVREGAWDAVESHLRSDLELTRFLAQKLRLIPSAESVAA